MSGDPLRVGLVGLGMMGRHHARILQRLDGIEFVGAADPAGDAHEVLFHQTALSSVAELVDRGIDAAVIAVPTAHHLDIALQVRDAGAHVLIEKPIAAGSPQGELIRDAFNAARLRGAVGHVERFNPALIELKRRLDDGELGPVISINTERVGPFPQRIQDVGVVKDLATHDIDLVMWLGSDDIQDIHAVTAHKMGREHEDLLVASGHLGNGIVVGMQVNWLTPVKQRTVTVLGERGAFVVDMLAADLTFYANASVPTEWDHVRQLRGVSEGNMIRYAFQKPEPLRVELEKFRDYVLEGGPTDLVTLERGVDIVRTAERIIASAAATRTSA